MERINIKLKDGSLDPVDVLFDGGTTTSTVDASFAKQSAFKEDKADYSVETITGFAPVDNKLYHFETESAEGEKVILQALGCRKISQFHEFRRVNFPHEKYNW